MSILRTISLMAALACISSSVSHAGLFHFGCRDSCTNQGCQASCCPADYCCIGDCKTEPLKQKCFETKCEAVCIPPVKFPCCGCCFGKLCGRGKCGGCGDGCGGVSCCNSSGGNGLISKLFGKFAKCRVRCVNTYKKKEYECGAKCVCTWKAVPAGCGSCGDGCGTGYTEGH